MTFYLRIDFIYFLRLSVKIIHKLVEPKKPSMKLYVHLIATVLFLINLSCGTQKNIPPANEFLSASALKPYGRSVLKNSANLELISSASHFGFSFEGEECRIYASISNANGHNYLQYELDGVYKKRIKVSGGSPDTIVISAEGEGKHVIWIYKATEAHTGPISVQKVEGGDIKSISKSPSPIIEFIGNSITCGAAADPSEVPCGTGEYHDQHNAYQAYGPRVARALQTDFVLSSVSGIGIYRNWNSDWPIMPQVYEKLDFQPNSQPWNFHTYTPEIVSIALGTNDFSNGDGKKPRLPFNSENFVNNYVKFIQLVKSKYPKAKIALLSSPMVHGDSRLTFENCLLDIKTKIDVLYPSDRPAAFYLFEEMQAQGCSGHPNVEDHDIMAKKLIPFFKALL